jgi:hypothetical protein
MADSPAHQAYERCPIKPAPYKIAMFGSKFAASSYPNFKMSNTSFLSSLSFFNEKYREVNINEPESTEESGLRTSSNKPLRKPFNHNAPRTRLSSWTNDDDGESRF